MFKSKELKQVEKDLKKRVDDLLYLTKQGKVHQETLPLQYRAMAQLANKIESLGGDASRIVLGERGIAKAWFPSVGDQLIEQMLSNIRQFQQP